MGMQGLRWILEALPVGVWVGRAPNGEVEYSNPGLIRLLGLDVMSDSPMEARPPNHRLFDRQGRPYPVEQLPFFRVIASREFAVTDDIVVHHDSGRKLNIRTFGYPVFDAEKNLTHVVVVVIEITKEVKAEVERQATESRLALAVNHAPIVIWATDLEGIIQLSEGAGLAGQGVKAGELVGQSVFDLYKDHPTIAGYLRRGLSGESIWYSVEVGDTVYDTWMTPLRDAAGVITGAAALSRDVTEVRKLQASVIQSDRVIALGTLAASVAHEINNPLTYMLGHTQLLRDALVEAGQILSGRGAPEDGRLRDLVHRMSSMIEPIHSGTQRIGVITRELRTFSRPEAGALTIVDICSVVKSVLQLVGKELEARARLVVDLGETVPVRGQQAKLVQVVLNLVVNAMHAIPDGSAHDNEIAVRTQNEGDVVVIEVSDTGPGVPAGDRERIFDPFVSTKDIGEGSGLGLFVCRNIARGFAGDVTVGDRPGGGAVFRVVLPVASSAPVVDSEQPVSSSAGRASGRVLIVDDEPMIADVLGEQLMRAGYHVTIEYDAERTLEVLAQGDQAVDLVFCDLMMKHVTGMDLWEALTRRQPAALAKVVFMTGGAFTPRARAFIEDHPDQVVEKPFDVVAEADRRLCRLRDR
jgi:PAS domain S-box-containing protein